MFNQSMLLMANQRGLTMAKQHYRISMYLLRKRACDPPYASWDRRRARVSSSPGGDRLAGAEGDLSPPEVQKVPRGRGRWYPRWDGARACNAPRVPGALPWR